MSGTTKTDFQPIPEGEYLVRMSRVEEIKTKVKGVPALKVSYQVIRKEGDEENESKTQNRLIFETMLTEHSNPKVEEITKDRLGKYLKAIGITGGLSGIDNDFSKLKNYLETPFLAKVVVRDDGNGYGPSNKIASFKSR